MNTEGSHTEPAGDACLEFQSALPGWLEGEEQPVVKAHAAECEFCRCVLTDLENIARASSEAALEEPPAALWASIRGSLIKEKIIRNPGAEGWQAVRFGWLPWRAKGFMRYPALIAAAAIVALIVSFKAPGFLATHPMQSVNTLHPAAFMQDDVEPQEISQLRQTVSQLDQAYLANQASMEPSMRATYQSSLDSLNSEIEECRASMRSRPGDGLTQDYLSKAYVEKARVLQTALEYNLR